jgi:hypothetical protein
MEARKKYHSMPLVKNQAAAKNLAKYQRRQTKKNKWRVAFKDTNHIDIDYACGYMNRYIIAQFDIGDNHYWGKIDLTKFVK